MPRLLFIYLARRIGLSAVIVLAALCVPAVLSSLLSQLPTAAVRGGLLWPAMMGVTPTVAIFALPMAMGLSTALAFSQMASEGMIAVLYALRLSTFAICRPALTLAVVATLFGYALSNVIAPHYAGTMQDVLNVVRNSLNHRMLDASHFYTFDNGVKTLYLERWETPDIAVNLFVWQRSIEKMEDQVVMASRAEFRRVPTGVVLALTHGSILTHSLVAGGGSRIVSFEEHVLALPMQGSGDLPQRAWHGVYELGPAQFFAQYATARTDPRQLADWTTEAITRLGVPALALGHTLLALALALRFGNVTGRRGGGGEWTIFALPATHIAFLVVAQTLPRADARLAIVVAALALLEIVGSLAVLARLNFALRPRPLELGVNPA